MAPGANIVYVGAASDSLDDMFAALNFVVDKRLASIVSNSYIIGEEDPTSSDINAYHQLAFVAAKSGIGFYFGSGDNGDYTASTPPSSAPEVEWPAAMDNVVAVGGTALALDQTGHRFFEVGFADELYTLTTAPDGTRSWTGGFYHGAGGGVSVVFPEPDYQKGIVPPALAQRANGPGRVLPDVAMLASIFTGFLIAYHDDNPNSPTHGQYLQVGVGGTSLACPLFAGAMALAEQRAGRKLGFAAPALYQVSADSAFRDIAPLVPTPLVGTGSPTTGVNRIIRADFSGQTIKSAPGFDNVTGLGVPDGENFLSAVAHCADNNGN
jgi:subtilase family serine protease